ncbi:ornithine decarboxylase [Plasmopara halstedii]|uniref:ornithine decarboxylase n=1 Tax=Plasmopara halstedii TaxID=4781 RepID=A0A0P1A9D0_PLAHL|nr:ornithine decarboxylase [Plasmopara halstedii]CEG37170.1 ornithine decarboxylase [Plasmopara halstedii]|eukprot:XP_024573539.1 ornithine decarboxylase [Plasmopara halstedii]
MALLFRGTSVSRAALTSASRLASRFGHERSAAARYMSTQAARATLISSDLITAFVNAKPPPELQRLQLNPAILTQLQTQIQSLGNTPISQRDAFYVVDTAAVEDRYKLWHQYLPDVRPYYAVKCNPDPVLIQGLARLGAGFDCASQTEISSVLDNGVAADDIIYANPCKQGSQIAFAHAQGVDLMTFDSQDELTKIHRINPNAKLVLRLYVDDSNSICRLGTKFGAMVHDVPDILNHAKALNLDVIGVSFHVGSGCFNVKAYSDAVARARKVFDIGHSIGYFFNLLDIGGGFPGSDNGPIRFEDCARELKRSLAVHFPKSSGVQVISEPGRFFAASTHTLAVNVIGRKVAPNFEIPGQPPVLASAAAAAGKVPNYMYFVNDGLYASFNCMVYDHPTIHPVILSDAASLPMHKASLWGPTCDGMDCIMKEVELPLMDVGQWILFPSMGAYTCAAGSDFNGFQRPQKIYFDSNFVADDQQQFVH